MRILLGSDVSDKKVNELEAATGAQIVCADGKAAVLDAIGNVQAYVPGPWDEEVFSAAPELEWVHIRAAGVNRRLFPAVVESDVTLTNSAGVFAVPMAEHAFALMLAFARRLRPCMLRRNGSAQYERWKAIASEVHGRVRELQDSTLGIIGYGGIGRECARRGKGMGMRVIAIRRHPEPDRFADCVWDDGRLADLLGQSDWVIVSCALTEQTRGLIGEEELRRMKPQAVILNLARGAVINQPALLRALREGWIGGAGLDVTDPEPLPAEDPLWEMENVIVTPHVSGASPRTEQRVWELLVENARRFATGEPLLNVVDKEAGY